MQFGAVEGMYDAPFIKLTCKGSTGGGEKKDFSRIPDDARCSIYSAFAPIGTRGRLKVAHRGKRMKGVSKYMLKIILLPRDFKMGTVQGYFFY